MRIWGYTEGTKEGIVRHAQPLLKIIHSGDPMDFIVGIQNFVNAFRSAESIVQQIVIGIGIIALLIVIFLLFLIYRLRKKLKSLSGEITIGSVKIPLGSDQNIPEDKIKKILNEFFDSNNLPTLSLENAEKLQAINPKASVIEASEALSYKLSNITEQSMPGSGKLLESPVVVARKQGLFADDILDRCDKLIKKGDYYQWTSLPEKLNVSSEEAAAHLNDIRELLSILDLHTFQKASE